jgi:hypothetical protein
MEWISVKDELPQEDVNVLLYDGNEVFCGNHYLAKNNESCFGTQACDGTCYGWYEKNEITHWMPLPEPPKTIKVTNGI